MRSIGFGVLACAFAVGIVGCGGGGGGSPSGSGSNPGGGQPTPAANLTVNVTSAAINASIAQGDPYSATVSGTWSATNLGSGAVYLQVSDSANTFTLPAIQVAPANGAFSFGLPAAATLATGERTGTITVKACKDATCSSAHAGTSGSVGYRLTVSAVPDWETLQGNAAHNGYVPITLDPGKFVDVWGWTAQHAITDNAFLSFPVTGANRVYVGVSVFVPSAGDYASSFAGISENQNEPNWVKSIGDENSGIITTNPAFSGGKLYFGSANTDYDFAALDSSNGNTAFTSRYMGTPRSAVSPTPYGGSIYIQTSAPTSNLMSAIASVNGASGSPQWLHDIVNAEQGRPYFTPAVDEQRLYYQNNSCLAVLNRQTRAIEACIANPVSDATNFDSRFVPSLVGSRGNVLSFFYSYPPNAKRLLASYNIAGKTLEWTTTLAYGIYPAVANGVVYATHVEDGRVSLHALNETNGQVLWTWTPPSDSMASTPTTVYNVIATRNLVFFSAVNGTASTGATWAVDLNTRQLAWMTTQGGPIAISANRKLYIVSKRPNTLQNIDDQLVQIRLQ